mmetsp:Transcript_87816/g.223512  ORF Transcript_87816/g.223512 Transcript_87816/m.223512 type:complete len:207 (-) Transcript_87816:916-1536(-)
MQLRSELAAARRAGASCVPLQRQSIVGNLLRVRGDPHTTRVEQRLLILARRRLCLFNVRIRRVHIQTRQRRQDHLVDLAAATHHNVLRLPWICAQCVVLDGHLVGAQWDIPLQLSAIIGHAHFVPIKQHLRKKRLSATPRQDANCKRRHLNNLDVHRWPHENPIFEPLAFVEDPQAFNCCVQLLDHRGLDVSNRDVRHDRQIQRRV